MHAGSIMMYRIIRNSHGHQLKNQKILLPTKSPFATCSQRKLIIWPSPMKVNLESPKFPERIQRDIYIKVVDCFINHDLNRCIN